MELHNASGPQLIVVPGISGEVQYFWLTQVQSNNKRIIHENTLLILIHRGEPMGHAKIGASQSGRKEYRYIICNDMIY